MFIETPRLTLREFELEDCKQLAAILADLEAMKFSSTGVLSAIQTKRKFKVLSSLTKHIDSGNGLPYLKKVID